MRCPHCNLEIPIGQQFCGNCGKRVEVGFDHIQESVLADAAQRRSGILEKVLLNVIGALLVLWVGLKLLNDHYLETRFAGARTGSVCFTAPAPKVRIESRLEPAVAPPEVPMPRVDTVDAQGLGWRREPLKEKLLESSCAKEHREAVRDALLRGLKYLASIQDKDGGWHVAREGGNVQHNWGRVGVTALACLAFMGDGHTWVAVGEEAGGQPVLSLYANNVRNGINFLTAQQMLDGPDAGLIGPKAGHFMYNQGMATSALAEAYAMTGDAYLGKATARAVNYIISTQQKSGGWDYFEKPAARADTSVTCCQLGALYSAHMAGVKVPGTVFQSGLGWIDSVTDPETFNVGYEVKWDRTQKHVGFGPTAMGLMFQLYLGRSPAAESVRRQARSLLGLNPPEYNPKWDEATKAARLDYYYLYHASMAFHRLGGDDWNSWNKAMVKTLADSQIKTGPQSGAWPVHDPHSKVAGRVYSTAMALLTLECYYRYP